MDSGTASHARLATIWVVDDSPTQSRMIASVLRERFAVECFDNGGTALERLSNADTLPDLLLLDWVMPGLSGDEVCRFVRTTARTHDLPIVIVTASRSSSADVVLAFDSGANDIIAKPFVAHELLARVGSLVRAGQLRAEADRQRGRVAAINSLGRALLGAGSDVDAIVAHLAEVVIQQLADACEVSFAPGEVAIARVARRREGATAAQLGESVTLPVTVRGIAEGVATFTRDRRSEPFDARDLASLQTCLELVGLALEAAIRADAERATMRFHEEMVGMVGHDLRTPLSALLMGIDVLRDLAAAAPGASALLDRLERSTHRMTGIVDLLLDVTRARIGTGIPVARTPMDLHATAAAVLDELRLQHPAAQLELSGETAEGSWDADRIGQVISNLASNAIQYGLSGAAVRVELEPTADRVDIIVHNANQAAPISPALLASLFEPFQRGANATDGHRTGLGLGLYIVREIVRAHGGTITAGSLASGTTFRVSLPRA